MNQINHHDSKEITGNTPAISREVASDSTAPPALVDGSKATWGEKFFNQSVYGGAMFGANLLLSAGITYWSKHNATGEKIYKSIESVYRKIGFKNSYVITSLTNAFTLLMGGHVVAVTVVKPAEDKKSEIIRWLDEKHYGKDGELSPEIKAAHERIDHEMKPTWAGTFLARMGGWLAVQASAFTIGSDKSNSIQLLGKKLNNSYLEQFKGVEGYSQIAGTKIAASSPKWLARGVNKILKPVAGYNDPLAFQRYTEYAAMDTMYTAITAVTIKPINNWLMAHVPFFRTERKKPLPMNHIAPSPVRDEVEGEKLPETNTANVTPTMHTPTTETQERIEHRGTLAPSRETHLSASAV
jgi:hypothetical protein